MKNYVLPFFVKYVVVYSSKYKSEVPRNLGHIITSLYNNRNKPMDKTEIISLIKLVYSFNPEGKGKQRKRSLEETLDLLNQK